MSSMAAAVQLDEVPPATTQHDNPENAKLQKASSLKREDFVSRPGLVNPLPLPSPEEWLEVQAAMGCMYYGFYIGELALEKMLIARFSLKTDPRDCSLSYLALRYIRDVAKCPDLSIHIAYLPQRAKDLNPTIEAEVNDRVLILGLFALEKDAYLNRISQEGADVIAKLLESQPTWWRIAQLMSV